MFSIYFKIVFVCSTLCSVVELQFANHSVIPKYHCNRDGNRIDTIFNFFSRKKPFYFRLPAWETNNVHLPFAFFNFPFSLPTSTIIWYPKSSFTSKIFIKCFPTSTTIGPNGPNALTTYCIPPSKALNSIQSISFPKFLFSQKFVYSFFHICKSRSNDTTKFLFFCKTNLDLIQKSSNNPGQKTTSNNRVRVRTMHPLLQLSPTRTITIELLHIKQWIHWSLLQKWPSWTKPNP